MIMQPISTTLVLTFISSKSMFSIVPKAVDKFVAISFNLRSASMISSTLSNLITNGLLSSNLKNELHVSNYRNHIQVSNVSSCNDRDNLMIIAWREVILT